MVHWGDLRGLNGSQQKGFEQLCNQLAARERIPGAVRFEPHGSPDGGVECRWLLEDGSEVAWQAKFFREALSRTQWRQIDESVTSMLEHWPNVKRYTICLPRDLTNEGVSKNVREADEWDRRKNVWLSWADECEREVEFVRWGETEILERLAREEHAGRASFWFERDLFSDAWFRCRVEEALDDLNDRYLPRKRGGQVQVDTNIQKYVESLGRSESFASVALKSAKLVHQRAISARAPESPDGRTLLDEAIALARTAARTVSEADFRGLAPLRLEGARGAVRAATDAVEKSLEAIHLRDRDEAPTDRLKLLEADLRLLRQALFALGRFLDGDLVRTAESGRAFVIGEAGSGKSHLLAHAADAKTLEGIPAILVLADQLDASLPPLAAIQKRLGVDGSLEQFLGALEAAADVKGTRLLIMIDALNETTDRSYWRRHILSTIGALKKRENLGFVATVRSGFEDLLLPPGLLEEEVVLNHQGFAGLEFVASEAFFKEFGITDPAAPMLRAEFSNPLVLYLACLALEKSGRTTFDPGETGVARIVDSLVAETNHRLSLPSALDFDERDNLAERSLETLATAMARDGVKTLRRERVEEIVEPLLRGDGWQSVPRSKRLLEHLVKENLLVEEVSHAPEGSSIRLRFQFQLLEDWFLAQALISSIPEFSSVPEAFRDGGVISVFLGRLGTVWHRGLLEMFAIILPERFGFELLDCLVDEEADAAVLRALPRRAATSVSDRVVALVEDSLAKADPEPGSPFTQAMDAVLACSCIPGHRLNADFLSSTLQAIPMARRDQTWSAYVFDSVALRGDAHVLSRICDYAREPSDRGLFREAARLAAVVLVWSFSSSHRHFRDSATKSVVALLAANPGVCEWLLSEFSDTDDPYILERLFGAAYGCASRIDDTTELRRVALAVSEASKTVLPRVPHILLKDYVQGVFELASERGADLGEVISLPSVSYQWPAQLPTLEELESQYEAQVGGSRLHASVWSGMDMWSDFTRYVVGSDHWNLPWSSVPVTGEPPPNRMELLQRFKTELSREQLSAWNEWLVWVFLDDPANQREHLLPEDDSFSERVLPRFAEARPEYGDWCKEGAPDSNKEALTAFKSWALESARDSESAARTCLHSQLTDDQQRRFEQIIVPYVRSRFPEEYPFTLETARRWMLHHILGLGWDERLHGAVGKVPGSGHFGRSGHKPETLRKKYQWIAWHSFLGTVAECFRFEGGHAPYEKIQSPRAVPWRKYVRDIDPTCLLATTPQTNPFQYESSWWSPLEYDCAVTECDADWLRCVDHLPDFRSLFMVENDDGERWHVLSSERSFRETWQEEGLDCAVLPRRMDVLIQSYLLRCEDAESFCDWAAQQNFFGRWLPHTGQNLPLLRLHEYWWHPAYEDEAAGTQAVYEADETPAGRRLIVPDEEYLAENSTRDCSIRDTYTIRLPTRPLAELLDLRMGAQDGTVVDKYGRIAFADPSCRETGPCALLASEESVFRLREAGYVVVWTVLAEQFTRGLARHADRRAVSGAWRWDDAWAGGCHQHELVDGSPRRAHT